MEGDSAGSEKDLARILSMGISIVSARSTITALNSNCPRVKRPRSFTFSPPYHTPVPVRRLLVT